MKHADEPLTFHGYQGCGSHCRVRVFLPDDHRGPAAYVVLFTDDGRAAGTSITNAAEIIAATACRRFHLPPRRTIFVEHYDYRGREDGRDRAGRTESFDRVFFDGAPEVTTAFTVRGEPLPSLGEPTWKPWTREAVEELIGEALP